LFAFVSRVNHLSELTETSTRKCARGLATGRGVDSCVAGGGKTTCDVGPFRCGCFCDMARLHTMSNDKREDLLVHWAVDETGERTWQCFAFGWRLAVCCRLPTFCFVFHTVLRVRLAVMFRVSPQFLARVVTALKTHAQGGARGSRAGSHRNSTNQACGGMKCLSGFEVQNAQNHGERCKGSGLIRWLRLHC